MIACCLLSCAGVGAGCSGLSCAAVIACCLLSCAGVGCVGVGSGGRSDGGCSDCKYQPIVKLSKFSTSAGRSSGSDSV